MCVCVGGGGGGGADDQRRLWGEYDWEVEANSKALVYDILPSLEEGAGKRCEVVVAVTTHDERRGRGRRQEGWR